VAGENEEDAVNVVKILNQKGFSATVDILGEHTSNANTAREITKEYQKLLSSIYDQNLNCNISIKPSHLGMDVSMECACDNVNHLIDTAKNHNQFIRIDMEDSSLTNASIKLFKKCKEHYDLIGTVLQAYLFRSENDLSELQIIKGINLRLCKGIYREPANIAIQRRQDINNNFLKLLQFAFENNIYVGIATHDLFLISESYKLIIDLKIPKDRFEFQVLYGVPMSGWLEKHLENDYKVRVYVPFGKDWYDYSVRRLKENPNIAGYVIRDMFRR
jgi:proline dehydrogenase